MEDELHIPWANDALEKLVRSIVDRGEVAKVDFKSSLSLGTAGEKAELAKDIQAFANSYDRAYQNHGFIIVGAAPGQMLYTTFPQDADKMQATIDQIVREHLGPFVPTQLRHFNNADGAWGVIVVPPSRNAPHVFVRETEKFERGDIHVRSGTTTSRAEPADFARFYRVQLEDHTLEIRDQLRDLQRDVASLKKQKRAKIVDTSSTPGRESTESPPLSPATSSLDETDLISRITQTLAPSSDPISSGLANEARALRSFLDSKEIAWDLNNLTKETGRAVVDTINAKSGTLWEALAHLTQHDDAGKYEDAVIEALSELAFEPEAPAGTPFTSFGTGIRSYPLVTCLYIVFMIGLRKRRDKLLKRVMALTLSRRSYHEELNGIGYALFYVRRADEVFQATREEYPNARWCDGVGSYIEYWMSSNLYGVMPELERNKHFFYIAEFTLSILGATIPNISRPASGLFYYIGESAPIIERFLRTEGHRFKSLFAEGLKDALQNFDTWAGGIAHNGRCWGDGFQRGAIEAVFPSEKKTLN